MTPVIWQISGGPPKRDYSVTLLKYGVALVGPGDPGPWKPDRASLFEGEAARRIASEVRGGDILLLRSGLSKLLAVGIVDGEYQYLAQFDDVSGLDLQHSRRVHWFALPEGHDFGTAVFSNAAPLSQISHPEVLDYARRFVDSPPYGWKTAKLPELPLEEAKLEQAPDFLSDLIAQVYDLAELYSDGRAFGEPPAEAELVAHYVVPLLRLLGWPPERIGVEWRCVDVCAFRSLPRTPENLHYIVEAKRLGGGVENALAQAAWYLHDLGVQREIVVTDGLRYRLYSAEEDHQPLVYANLARLKPSGLELFRRLKAP